MADYVRSFHELTPEQRSAAGGKGGTLAWLTQAGYPVPDGFVILPTAFADDRLVPGAWACVQRHLAGLRAGEGNAAFAVRSSALSEDSTRASFAGEFETVLDVHTDDQVRSAIQAVRRSRHSARVQAYSRARGVESIHEMAVVVQRLVPADHSGVLFTADPLTGSRASMQGNYVRGAGDELVSGQATGESFAIQRPGGRYEGPVELGRVARQLFRLGSQLEQELDGPQDVEWAVAGGQLYLLQSRPITTLVGYDPATGEWNDSLTGDFLWSNVNLAEAIPDVMTPFSWSVIQGGALRNWLQLQGHHLVGNVGGRPYFNISVLASIFHLLGWSDRQTLDMIEGTLHFRLPQGMRIPLIPASRRALWTVLPRLVATQWTQARDVRRLPALLAANPAWCGAMRRRVREAATGVELASLWQEEIAPYSVRIWSAYLSGTNHYAGTATPLRRRLVALVGPDDADALISGLSSDSELLASLGPLVGLSQVARGEVTRRAYLEQHGHRGSHEFEFSIPRPAEDPTWLDRQLAGLEAAPVGVETLLAQRRTEVEAAWMRLRTRFPLRARVLRRRIDQIGPRARLREAVRSEFGRVTWIFRLWALRAGVLADLGDDAFFLTVPEVLDVLSGNEGPLALIPARRETYARYTALPPYPAVIRGRFDPFRWAADPGRRSDLFDSHAPGPVPAAGDGDPDTVVGAAGAAGRIEGLVRRLDGPEEGERLRQGEILVTAQTNIGWTVLFPRAGAIVTDVGAPLSHAAIVARELGIPAVVGCGDATMRLRTGDRVLVDGGRGIVQILEQ